MTLDIGARLKAVRVQANLTQRQLAKRTGATNASISLMESGRTNPSVSNLKRVLDGIPMSLAEFFTMEDPDRSPEDQVFFPADELLEIGKGKISYRQIGTNISDKSVQILHESYAPGADSGKIPLNHESEEGGVVISGRIELTVGTKKRILGAGDAYYFDSRIPHRFRNVGEEHCIIVSACAPPTL